MIKFEAFDILCVQFFSSPVHILYDLIGKTNNLYSGHFLLIIIGCIGCR